MKKYLFTLLCAALVLAGCSDIMAPAHRSNAKKEGLKITVSSDTASSRTLFPSAEFTKYVLSFENTDGLTHDEVTFTGSNTVVDDLDDGTWKITATGYVKINGSEYAAAAGSENVTILASGPYPKQVDISLSAQQGGAKGFFSYTVAHPEVDSASLVIAPWDGASAAITRNLLSDPSDLIELDSGYYLVTITLKKADQTAGLNEIVHIYSSMETKGSFEFTADDFTYITLSGTVEITYAGGPMPKLVITAQNDALGLLGKTEFGPAAKGAEWSIEVPSFDTATDITFDVVGYDSFDEEVFNQSFADAAIGVTDTGVSDILLKADDDIPFVMTVNYGTPSLTNPDDPSDTNYIDPLWNDAGWTDIKNINESEFGAGATQEQKDFVTKPTTAGKAKLYWDENGLWLYVDVTTDYITASAAYGPTNNAHDGASVELFINEGPAVPPAGPNGQNPAGTNYNNLGGQYRLDPYNRVSGDPGAASEALTALNKKNAFIKADGSGYVVIFEAPWRFKDKWPLKDNKGIFLEIQINAASQNTSSRGRAGVLKWYNTTANTYQNAGVLAKGTLKFGENPPAEAWEPNITTQPDAVTTIAPGAAMPALTVVATSPDNGILSYQWYSADNASGANGAAIDGAVEASYTPPESTDEETFYYYVVVTNTKGTDSKTKQSNVVQIRVADPNKVTVTFDSNGGSAVASVRIIKDTTMDDQYPSIPTKAGYNFDGWWDNNAGKEYFANTIVAADITLKAKWVSVPGEFKNYEVPLSGQTVRNAAASTDYGTMVSINVGAIDITKYTGSIIELIYFGGNGTPFNGTVDYNNAKQLIYEGSGGSGTIWNYGWNNPAGSVTKTGDVLKITRTGWNADGGTMPAIINKVIINGTPNTSIQYVQILSITFVATAPFAKEPVITTQPVDTEIYVNTSIPELTVVVTEPTDGGTLSYQWYKATDLSGTGGTAITGANEASYTPNDSTAAEVSYYYYVVVTNTRNDFNVSKTKRSDVVEVSVIDPSASSFTVTFDENGGDTKAVPQTQPCDVTSGVGALPTEPTKEDFIFVEWNTSRDGTGDTFTATTVVDKPTTVYAIWRADESTWYIEKIVNTTVGAGGPVFAFELPPGTKLSDYSGFSFKIKNNETFASNNGAGARYRAGGPMNATSQTTPESLPTPQTGDYFNYVNSAGTAGHNVTNTETINQVAGSGWGTFTLTFDSARSINWNDNTTGIVLFSLGVIGNGGGSNANTYYIKDVYLTKADGKNVRAMNSASTKLWGGTKTNLFARNNDNGAAMTVTRTKEAYEP
jgi:uncharacterized repeat protein (TIGR02543 family)